jgi:hypothetical protein
VIAFSKQLRLAASLLVFLSILLTARPGDAGRHSGEGWKVLQEAFEIVDIRTVPTSPDLPVSTYKSAGSNPIPDALWRDYTPPPPYLKNTTRNLQFNESRFLASPGEPLGTTRYVTTPDGYTWGAMSLAVNALWPYNPAQYSGPAAVNTYYAGNLVVTPPPGVVKVTANFKAQDIKFWANKDGLRTGTRGAVPLDRYFVTDQWGNEYVMHASEKSTQQEVAAAFRAAVLPPGWTKSTRRLNKDLILRPAEGADRSFHYLVFRDSADNSYHQIGWSPRGSLAAQVEGMPIWGGQDNDVLAGDAGGIRNDLMHGAAGNDRLLPGLGNDEVWGDDGIDTVVLPGRFSDWTLIDLSADFTQLTLSGPDGTNTKRIAHCEFLRFDDVQLPVRALNGRPRAGGGR